MASGRAATKARSERDRSTPERARTRSADAGSGHAPHVQRMCAPCKRAESAARPAPVAPERRPLGHELAPPVQTKCAACEAGAAHADDASTIHDAARPALAHASSELPHRDRIQHAFGRHDLSGVRAVVGGPARDANDRMGASAFTSGSAIAFREAPDLRLAAHESAHVVQQREGLSVPGNVGQAGDPWERHADRVADAVVAGESAEPLLDAATGSAPSAQRAPAVQREDKKPEQHPDETKGEFAKRVYALAASRLTRNIGVLDEWSTYVSAMEAFQLKAQLFTTQIATHAITAAKSPLHQQYFETEMGTHSPQEQAFYGAMNDPEASYRETSGALINMIIANAYSGTTSVPSVAEEAQVIAGQKPAESLVHGEHLGTRFGYEFYRPIAKQIAEGKAGPCETCHEINRAWGLTIERYGTPLPRDDWFASDRFGNKLPKFGTRGFLTGTSADQMQLLQGYITRTPPPAETASAVAAPVGVAAADPTAAPANPFVPDIPIPKGVEIPPPRSDLCGDLPSPEDSDRKLDIKSWGPNSAIVANVIEHVNAVLLPLGPRGYRVLPRQSFDALYSVSPTGMEGLRGDILGRIKKKQDAFGKLRKEIQSSDPPPYAEFCPLVDELLPTTNPFTAYQAIEDVHAWQRKERILQILELTLLAISVLYPPSVVLTVPAGMVLGLVRIGLGIDQRRQGRQWVQGTGAGIYSLQQEAEAPGLADRGKKNIIAGAFEFGLSAFSAFRILQQIQSQQAMVRLLKQMETGTVEITSSLYPSQILKAQGGKMMLVDTETRMILGYGSIKDGQVFWRYIRAPFPGAAGAGSTGGGGIPGLVPYGPTSVVPFAQSPIGSFAPTPTGLYAPTSGLVAPTAPLLFGPVQAPLAFGPVASPLLLPASSSSIAVYSAAPTTSGAIVPGVRGGEFDRWFNALDADQLDQLWAQSTIREAIEARLRHPGGMHEWHLVSRAPSFKRWGLTAQDIKDLRTAIKDVKFKNPAGHHGGKGSTAAHNELLDIIDSSLTYGDFVRRLRTWAHYRLEGGAPKLPGRLSLPED